jgi:hypothetical protein
MAGAPSFCEVAVPESHFSRETNPKAQKPCGRNRIFGKATPRNRPDGSRIGLGTQRLRVQIFIRSEANLNHPHTHLSLAPSVVAADVVSVVLAALCRPSRQGTHTHTRGAATEKRTGQEGRKQQLPGGRGSIARRLRACVRAHNSSVRALGNDDHEDDHDEDDREDDHDDDDRDDDRSNNKQTAAKRHTQSSPARQHCQRTTPPRNWRASLRPLERPGPARPGRTRTAHPVRPDNDRTVPVDRIGQSGMARYTTVSEPTIERANERLGGEVGWLWGRWVVTTGQDDGLRCVLSRWRAVLPLPCLLILLFARAAANDPARSCGGCC